MVVNTNKVNLLSIFYGLFCTAILVVSCAAPVGKTVSSPKPLIDTAANTTKTVSEGMGKVADSIDKRVDTVRKETPAPVIQKIEPQLTGINQDTGTLRELKGRLDSTTRELEAAISASREVEEQSAKKDQVIAEKDKQIAQLEADKKNDQNKLTFRLILLSIVGLGISGALVYTGNKAGIASGVGCGIVLALSVLVAKYSLVFLVAAVVLMLAGAAFLVWELYKRNKISTELVATVEVDKMAMRDPARQYIYGNGAMPGQIEHVQSPATKKFVQKVRKAEKVKLAPSVKPVQVGTNNPNI